jgi:hypothetical protein
VAEAVLRESRAAGGGVHEIGAILWLPPCAPFASASAPAAGAAASAATATLELMDTPPMALPGNEALAHQARRRAAARCWGSRRVCRPG